MMDSPPAQWTLHPITEREIDEERRQTQSDRRIGWLFALVSLGFCPFACLGSMLEFFGPWPGWIALCLFAILAIEKIRHGVRGDRLIHAKRRSLQEAHRELSLGWPVRIVVLQGTAQTGEDRGLIWFEEGRLFFAGDRTSFGLVPSQIGPGLREASILASRRIPATLFLKERTQVGTVALEIDLLPRSPFDTSLWREKSFRDAYTEWIVGPSEGLGQLPPLTLGPDAPSASKLLVAALVASGFWIVLVVGLIALATQAAWWIVPPAAAATGTFLLFWDDFWIPRLRWRAWRDRRRLEGGTR